MQHVTAGTEGLEVLARLAGSRLLPPIALLAALVAGGWLGGAAGL